MKRKAKLKINLSVEQYDEYMEVKKYKYYLVLCSGEMNLTQIAGFTLGKYLQYLKFFKDEMVLEEDENYLQAESHGMDREHLPIFERA